MTITNRRALERQADAILKADNDNKPAGRQARFRGGRPALNWLSKHDAHGAAALWLIARQRLPQAANDNRADAAGMDVDRRPSGKPRGPRQASTDAEKYLDLPAAMPSPLAAASLERVPVRPLTGFHGWYDIKPAIRCVVHADCCYTLADAAVAEGAWFMGAEGGLGQPRQISRADVRRVDAPETPTPPTEIDSVIEAVLARATVAGVGEALGANGGYADRRGKKALRAAGEWARCQIVPARAI